MSNLWNLSPGFSPAPVCPSNRACPGDRAMIRWRRGGRLLTGWFASLFMAIPLSGNAQPIRVEAVSGVPFGVGSIILPRGVEGGGDPWADGRMDIRDAAGRLLYPVYGDGPVRQLIRDYAGIRGRVRLYFLFRGGDPLNVQLHIPQEVRLHVVPRAVPADVYRRQLLGWWRAYTRAAELRTRVSDYPPMVDAYLTSMFGWAFAPATPVVGCARPVSMALVMGRRCRDVVGQRVPGVANPGVGAVAGGSVWRPGRPPASRRSPLAGTGLSRCGGRPSGRADRAARAGRLFLPPLRHLRELCLDAGLNR